MALALAKPKYQIHIDTTKIYITDITGQYDVDDNPGGWGAPNFELAQSAVAMLVQRVLDGEESSMSPISNSVVYDPVASNTKETVLDFTFSMDGHIKITIFRLPVSLDGTTKVEGGSIANNEYFYWSNTSLFWQMVDGVPVAKDLEDLVGVGTVVQSTCEDLVYPKLAVEFNTKYTEYMEERDDDDCEDAEKLFDELQHFRMDLAGAKYRFRNGSVGSAEDIIQSLLKKYDLLV